MAQDRQKLLQNWREFPLDGVKSFVLFWRCLERKGRNGESSNQNVTDVYHKMAYMSRVPINIARLATGGWRDTNGDSNIEVGMT